MGHMAMFVKLEAKPGRRDDLIDVLEGLVPAVEAEEGTLLYTFHRDMAEEDVVWVYERYRDAESLEAHTGGEALKAALGRFDELLAGPMTVAVTEASAKSKGVPG